MKKPLLYLFFFILNVFVLASKTYAAYTWDWNGNSSSAWTTAGNWTKSGTGAVGINYPGQGGSTNDIVRIGVTLYSTNAPFPVLTTALTCQSLEFGYQQILSGLTVNGATLNVSSITEDHYTPGSGYNDIVLDGTGTIICNGSFTVGNGGPPPAPTGNASRASGIPPLENLTSLYCFIATLNITGTLIVNSASSALGTYKYSNSTNTSNYSVNNGYFYLQYDYVNDPNNINYTPTNNNSVVTVPNITPTMTGSGYENTTDNNGNTVTSQALYEMGLTSNVNILHLTAANPVTSVTGGLVDFLGSGSVTASTVYYDGTTPTQEIYTATGIGVNPTEYANLILNNSSTKNVDGGTLTVGGNFTSGGGQVNFNANNPIVTVSGFWANSTTANEGTGKVSISNNLTNNTGGSITGGTSTTTVTGTLTNAGLINCNGESMTFTGAAINTSTITGGSGALTFGSTLNNSSGATITTGNGITTITGAYLNSASTFSMASGTGNVIFKGNYGQGSGSTTVFTAGSGTVVFSGGAQSLLDNSTLGTVFNNVTLSGTGGIATMSSEGRNFSVSPKGLLTMASTAKLTVGATTTGGASYLTLQSDSTGSAAIAQLPSTATNPISGNLSVQRFLTGARGYRLLSWPVYYAADANGINDYNINKLTSYLYVTGTAATAGGFSNSVAGNPTLYLFNESFTPQYSTFLNSNFIGVNSLNSAASPPVYSVNTNGANLVSTYTLPASTGLLCFYRGRLAEGTTNLTTPSHTPVLSTVVTTTGLLIQNQVKFKDWYSTPANYNLGFTTTSPLGTQGFNLTGNPYASNIDLETATGGTLAASNGIVATGLSRFVYTLNPTSHVYGVYTIGSVASGTNGASRYIESGEGFLVLASASTSSLTYNETAKATSASNATNSQLAKRLELAELKPTKNTADPYLKLALVLDSVNSEEILLDFNKAASTNYAVNEDAPYKSNSGLVSLSSVSADKFQLAVNTQPLPVKGGIVPLAVYGNSDGTYSLKMNAMKNIPGAYDIWLKDAYLKDSLDIKHNPTYAFSILHSDTNSFGKNRFTLVIRLEPGLNVHLLQFAATKATSAVNTTWTVENEANYTGFNLQKSTDGVSFATIDSLLSDNLATYSYTDSHPQTTNYYRLQITDVAGNITYSAVVPVMYNNTAKTNNIVNIYPNPTNNMINIAVNQGNIATSGLQNQTVTTTTPATGLTYDIKITNMTGEVLKTVTAVTATWQNNVSSLLPGTYIIQVFSHGSSSVVGRTTFVKL